MHKLRLLGALLSLSLALSAQTPGAPSAPPARTGVKVDAAAEAEKNPRPPFMADFGRLLAGTPAPGIDVLKLDGTTTRLSDLMAGRVTVVGYWPGRNGPGAGYLAAWKEWSGKYPDLNFVGFGAYASLEEVKKWAAENAPSLTGIVVADTAGAPPSSGKPREEMTDDELVAFRKQGAAYSAKAFSTKLGGVGAPVPTTMVFDAAGRFVGWSVGFTPRYADSIGNLLLRAGVKLAPADMPAKVWTNEEIAAATPKPEPRVEMLKIGTLAPDFGSQTLDGKDVKLSDFRGQVVILDFWATWCGPCIAAMPHTQEVAVQYKDQGVVVLANCTSDIRAKFEQWVKTNQEKYPDIVWTHDQAERGPDRVSRKLYGVGGIPTQFIIDREGRVADIVIGYIKGEVILDAALAKAGVKVDPAIIAKGAADLKRR